MEVIFYETASSRSPVIDFIEKLPANEQVVIFSVLKDFKRRGMLAQGCNFRQLEGKLWEIKIRTMSGGYRFLYVWLSEERVIVLHVFKKKTQKTPLKEIRLAKKRMKELI
jgi:phage-related protein